jgi:GDP-mannose 6-dehydrogenase
MLAGILPSNKGQIERAAQIILKTGARKVGLWGLAFKPGTDDLRESPLVTLAELLCGKGVDLGIHDEFVQVARLVGGNKAFIEQVLPHLARLLVQSPEDLNACELIIVGHPAPAGKVPEWLAEGKTIVDLCGLRPAPIHPAYIGIV